MFILMSKLGQTYDSAMRIPWSRRRRFIEELVNSSKGGFSPNAEPPPSIPRGRRSR